MVNPEVKIKEPNDTEVLLSAVIRRTQVTSADTGEYICQITSGEDSIAEEIALHVVGKSAQNFRFFFCINMHKFIPPACSGCINQSFIYTSWLYLDIPYCFE